MNKMFDAFPQWFQIFFWSMVPWVEARYTIPFLAMDCFKWSWWQAFPIAVAGNILPVPFILLFFHLIEKFLRRFKSWAKIMDRLFAFTRSRADDKIRRYEHLGLLLFVVLPVPFTGAWTGALIAYLFDLQFSRSLVTIFVGIVIAAGIMTFIALTGLDIYILLIGVLLAGIVMTILTVVSISKLRKEDLSGG